MIELVMFDADGVLFDSDESNVAYYNWIFAQVGEPPLDRNEEISAISYAASEVFAARTHGDAAKLRAMQDLPAGWTRPRSSRCSARRSSCAHSCSN